jgi:hypothetical protein
MSDMDTETFAMGSIFDHLHPDVNHQNTLAHNINACFDFDALAAVTPQPQEDFSANLFDLSAIDINSDMQVENTAWTADLYTASPCWTCTQVLCECNLSGSFEFTTPLAVIGTCPSSEPYLTVVEASQSTSKPEISASFGDWAFPSIDLPASSVDNPQFEQVSRALERIDPPLVGVPKPQPIVQAARKRGARIKSATLAILDRQFGIDVYPKVEDVSSLVKATKLTAKEIKTWFSNARARRKQSKSSSQMSLFVPESG